MEERFAPDVSYACFMETFVHEHTGSWKGGHIKRNPYKLKCFFDPLKRGWQAAFFVQTALQALNIYVLSFDKDTFA